MPAFLEDKLREEYGDNDHAIYGTMNKIGAMHGNKETEKGREMERKHAEHVESRHIHGASMHEHVFCDPGAFDTIVAGNGSSLPFDSMSHRGEPGVGPLVEGRDPGRDVPSPSKMYDQYGKRLSGDTNAEEASVHEV